MKTIAITYTTLYREGGQEFKQAAITMAAEKRKVFPNYEVLCQAVESKSEFLAIIDKIKSAHGQIFEFHFIGHSGVYGIMFGTRAWPEQFSPFEWKQQSWPLTSDAKIYFHACRTARWFAPFLANHFQVPVLGYWWYTTVSGSPNKFSWVIKNKTYITSCPGRKSHGPLASVLKYAGLTKIYPMIEFKPEDTTIDSSYDSVATFYEETFEDLKVRKDEWDWLMREIDFSQKPKILDIGCGNGAFLRQIADRLSEGQGVDASPGMLEVAKQKAFDLKKLYPDSNLNFTTIKGPQLPFPNNHFDYVTSVLSFRYLDWDPMIHEILRVLKPGGRLLILDMVAAPIKFYEWPQLLISKFKHYIQRWKNPRYYQPLSKMVHSPSWQRMLKYNPIRAEHEYKWYLKSRFPEARYGCINIGWNSRIITFASPPIHFKTVQKQSFP